MKLGVVVCTYDRPESLGDVLESIFKQSSKIDEVVLVVGGNGDKVEDLIERMELRGEIKLVNDLGEGLAKARDMGWRRAESDLVAWIDDDVVLDKDWAKSIKEIFNKDDKIGGLSGPTIIAEKLLSERAVFWWYPYYQNDSEKIGIKNVLSRLWVWWFLDNDPYRVGKITKHWWWSPGSNFLESLKLKKPVEVDYLEACNMILKRELVERVGGFDLGYRGTSEWCEVDLVMRVRKREKCKMMFDPKVKVEHKVSRKGVYAMRRNLVERVYNYGRFVWKTKLG